METVFNTISTFVHSQAGYIFSGILFGVVVTLVMLTLLKFTKTFTAPIRYSAWWLVLIAVIAFPVVASVTAYSFFSNDTVESEKIPVNQATPRLIDDNQVVWLDNQEPVLNKKPKSKTFIYRPNYKPATPQMAAVKIDPKPPKADKPKFHAVWYAFIPFLFMLTWSAIATVMILRILMAYFNILKLKKDAVPFDISGFKRVERFMIKKSLKRKVSVCFSDKIEVPIAAGLGKAVVLIPTRLADKLTEDEIEIIILHELAHLVRWDDWSNLGQKLIGAVNFYHPAVHWINKQIDLNREIACDSMVVEHTGNPKKYAECLTRIMQLTVGSGTTLMSNAYTGDKQIFKRFESILLKREQSNGKFKLRLISICAVVAIMAFTFLKVSPVIAFPGDHLTYSDINSGLSLLVSEFSRDEEPTTETNGEGSSNTEQLLGYDVNVPVDVDIPAPDFEAVDVEELERMLEDLSDYEVKILSKYSESDIDDLIANNIDAAAPVYVVPPVPAAPAVPSAPSQPYVLSLGNGNGYYVLDKNGKDVTGDIDFHTYSRSDIVDLSTDLNAHVNAHVNAVSKAKLNSIDNAKFNALTNAQVNKYFKELEKVQASSSWTEAIAMASTASEAGQYAQAHSDFSRFYRGRPKRGFITGLIDWSNDLFSGRYSGTIHSDNDDEKTIMWSDGTNIVGMKVLGDVIFTDDDHGIKQVEKDGYVTIFEKTRRNKIELDIFINEETGELDYYYLVNRKEQDFDDEAKEWFADIVYEVITKTGVGFEQRAPRIYKEGGLDAVMKALEEIESSYVKGLYFEYLVLNENLSEKEYQEIMVYTERELDSDYEKAELLIAIAEVAQNDPALIDEYIAVVKSLDSDYEIKRVLTAIDFSNHTNRDNLIDIMEIIDYMDSDYEKAELLVEIAPACEKDEQLKEAYIEKLHEIDSDYELRRIFSALSRRTDFNKSSLTELLTLAETLDSDYEKAEFLYDLSGRIDNDPALMMILVNATATIDSDYEKRKVLNNLYEFSYDCIKDEKLIRAQLEIVEKFDSDYEKTQVLHDLAECVGQNDNLVDDYLYVLRDLSSDYEYKRALIYLIKSSDLKKPVVLKILRATEDIDSDYEKSEVLSKLVRTVKDDDEMEDAFIGVLETFSHNSYEADQLYKKLRRSKRYDSDEG